MTPVGHITVRIPLFCTQVLSFFTRNQLMNLMMRFLIICLFLLLSSNLFAQTSIRFLHMNDLHAHLVPHHDVVRDGDPCVSDPNASTFIGERGGLARLKTLLDSLRTEAQQSVLMNVGDTYHGGAEALYSAGNAIVDPVNSLGIDVAVPGNWDFAYGPAVFRKRYTPDGPFPILFNVMLPSGIDSIKTPGFPYLAANLRYEKINILDGSPDGELVLPPTMVQTYDGVDVGFIGLTSDIVQFMYEGLARGFSFTRGETAYVSLLNSLSDSLRQSGAEVVVVLSELGIHKDLALADAIAPASVDVFFSAHTHEVTYVPLSSASGALVVEAGNDGFLGRMDLTISTGGSISSWDWELIPVTAALAEDPVVKALVDAERAPFLMADPNLSDPNAMGLSGQELHQPIDAVIGHSHGTLTRMDALESSFNNAFTDMARAEAGTDLALSPGFRFDSPILGEGLNYEDQTVADGAITLEDAYRFFPVAYTMRQGEVRGDTLKGIVERLLTNVFSKDMFAQEGGWVDGFSGISLTVNLQAADGTRVTAMMDSDTGMPINGGDALTVVGCQRPLDADGVICSHTGFENTEDFVNPSTGSAWTVVDLFVSALSQDTLAATTRDDIVDVSGQSTFPEYPWVQPLPVSATCAAQATGFQEEVQQGGFRIFPNPTQGELHYILPNGKAGATQLILTDCVGREVFRQTGNLPGEGAVLLPRFPAGVYWVTFLLEHGTVAEKLLISY